MEELYLLKWAFLDPHIAPYGKRGEGWMYREGLKILKNIKFVSSPNPLSI